jgi:thiol-disulfide isomerase/thioredoxin
MKTPTIQLLITCLVILISCTKQNDSETYSTPIRTVVTGKVINPVKDTPVALAVNRLGFEQERIETAADSNGYFKIEFLSYVPVDAWVVYQTNFLVLLKPGDSLHLEFDGSHDDRSKLLKTIRFTANSAEINSKAAIFQKLYFASSLYDNWDLVEKANKEYDPSRFKTFADSLRKESRAFLDDFVKQHNPDQELLSWATLFLLNDYYSNLTFYPASHRKANVLKQSEWSVPLSYYDYFKEDFDIEESLANNQAVRSYLDKYMSYLRAITRDKLKGYDESIAASQPVRDSVILELIMKMPSSRLLREASLTYMFHGFLEYSDIESFEKYRSLAEENLHSAFLREPLFKAYETTRATLAKQEEIEFKKVNALDKFLDGLFTKNKGKITYVDIWATWCGPCREEFPYAKELQTNLSDSVKFVFVCIDSEQRAFENTMKEFQLKGDHYFLDKKQSKTFSEELHLNGVPHYLLIDQNGKIVADGFEFRPSEDATKAKIRKLLRF